MPFWHLEVYQQERHVRGLRCQAACEGWEEMSLRSISSPTRECVVCGTKDLDKFSWCGPNRVGKYYLRHRCDPCRVKQAYKRRNPAYRAEKYYCEKEPWGIYKKGSTFNFGDMKRSLDAGYMPPGSVWVDRIKGRRWKVVGNELWYSLQELIAEPSEDVKCESQRLVELGGKRQPPRSG